MNIFKQFIKSLYSPKDIARFRFQGIGKTILYVFFISLLAVIPISFYAIQTANEAISVISSVVSDELPAFTIENGKLHSDETEVITIEKNDFTLIFDSTGEVNEQTLKKHDNTVAILSDEFLIVAGGQIQSTAYSLFSSFTVTKEDIVELISQVNSALPVILIVTILIMFLFGSGMKFLEVSILALFGLILKNMTGHRLQYQQLWRLAAYSITIPTVFFTIMAALKTTVPGNFLLHWGVSITVLYLVMKEIPQQRKQP